MLNALRRSSARKRQGASLHAEIVRRAREPVFFARLGVPDTIDGRFDMVALHGWLALEWLKGARQIAQSVTDALFVGFEGALRDLGVGDMGLGRRMKQMGNAFYGRLQAYGTADNLPELSNAILRNVFRGDESRRAAADALATYAWNVRGYLSGRDPAAGTLDFGPLP